MVLHAHTQRVYENGDQNSSLEDPALDECLQALARKATHFVKSALGKSLAQMGLTFLSNQITLIDEYYDRVMVRLGLD